MSEQHASHDAGVPTISLIAGFEDEVDADGHRLVVRNGPELYGLRNACLQLCAASTPWNAAQPMRCAFTSR